MSSIFFANKSMETSNKQTNGLKGTNATNLDLLVFKLLTFNQRYTCDPHCIFSPCLMSFQHCTGNISNIQMEKIKICSSVQLYK